MSFALNEVEATARKATRGAGYDWGIAEDAAKATRWLCAHGMDGTGALLRVLTGADGADPRKMAPQDLRGDWRAAAGALCPLMAGTALSDSAGAWEGDSLRLEAVIAPVMLLPFVAFAARQLETPITVEWAGVRAVADGSGASLWVADGTSLLDDADEVLIRTGGQSGQPLPRQSRATPDPADWNALNLFAHRTYAPDTEASRLMGAGAGLSDND